jgi:hypothetical protein
VPSDKVRLNKEAIAFLRTTQVRLSREWGCEVSLSATVLHFSGRMKKGDGGA